VSDQSPATTDWSNLPIVCPHCGNHGADGGEWMRNSHTPFKLVEDVVRSFEFVAQSEPDGTLRLVADVESDSVDWESGTNMRIECMQCLGNFELPDQIDYDFV
jgi:hypothetical protein